MLDNVLKLVKNTVADVISGDSSVPSDKKDNAIEAVVHSLGDGLRQNFTQDKISGLSNLLENRENISSSNSIVSNLINTVENTLTQKVGLSQSSSGSIASKIVSTVMNLFSQKINDPDDKGFNIGSLVSSLSGSAEGILNSIGKLFGK